MKRILFLVITNAGGVGRMLTLLANSLSEYFDISILETDHYSSCRYDFNAKIKFLGSIINNENGAEPKQIKNFKAFCIANYPELLRSIYGLTNYDFVIACDYNRASFMLPAFSDICCINWLHTSLINFVDGYAVSWLNEQKHIWKSADAVILISKAQRRIFDDIAGEYSLKAKLIYNPFDAEEVRKKATASCDFHFDDYDFPFACCIGRLDKNKNFEFAIWTINYLRDKGTGCGLILIGTGEEREKLKTLVKDLHLQDLVFFLGEKENPYPYLARCLCLCCTSLQECFPTVVCEAMALGKPFISTPVSGASEELAFGETCGFVVPYNNVPSYAEKIKILLEDNLLYKKMSENCLEHIKNFSTKKTTDDFMELFKNLKKKRHSVKLIAKKKAWRKIKLIYIFLYQWRMTITYNTYLNNLLKQKSLRNYLKFIYYLVHNCIVLICYMPIRIRERKFLNFKLTNKF